MVDSVKSSREIEENQCADLFLFDRDKEIILDAQKGRLNRMELSICRLERCHSGKRFEMGMKPKSKYSLEDFGDEVKI